MRKVYGWQDGDDWYLSKFKKEPGRPVNKYKTKEEVIQETEGRGIAIEWLQ